jgi:hypothetical protein
MFGLEIFRELSNFGKYILLQRKLLKSCRMDDNYDAHLGELLLNL